MTILLRRKIRKVNNDVSHDTRRRIIQKRSTSIRDVGEPLDAERKGSTRTADTGGARVETARIRSTNPRG